MSEDETQGRGNSSYIWRPSDFHINYALLHEICKAIVSAIWNYLKFNILKHRWQGNFI